MFLDGLMGVLPTDASTHTSHKDLSSRQEGQVALKLSLNDSGERPEVAKDRQKGLKSTINGIEGIGQRHTTHHRTGHVTLVPLHSRQTGGHSQIAT